jgi:imidazolonepropionase
MKLPPKPPTGIVGRDRKPDLIVYNTSLVLTCAGKGPRRGPEQDELHAVPDGAVAVTDGRIAAVGPVAEVMQLGGSPTTLLDARGGIVMPGMIDPHTHPVYGGNRADEFIRRLGGASYEELHAAGGGIQATVDATRKMRVADLVEGARGRLWSMFFAGVTTFEAKSGYGLTVASEMAQLQAIRELDAEGPWELVPTFLGAHALPREFADDREGYVDLVCEKMIPKVTALELAEYCDVFCEHGAFTVEESRRILQAGQAHGLAPKVHADELSPSGGTRLGVELGARSVDHLPYVSDEEIGLLAESKTAAVLLPATTFFLFRDRYAPGRKLVDAGVIVTLASDHNPGSSHTLSMGRVIELGVMRCGLTVREALNAVTVNAAYAVGREDELGSIEPGKQADLVILNVSTPEELIYAWGVNHVVAVVKRGKLVDRRRQPDETRPKKQRFSDLFS